MHGAWPGQPAFIGLFTHSVHVMEQSMPGLTPVMQTGAGQGMWRLALRRMRHVGELSAESCLLPSGYMAASR